MHKRHNYIVNSEAMKLQAKKKNKPKGLGGAGELS